MHREIDRQTWSDKTERGIYLKTTRLLKRQNAEPLSLVE